MRFLPTLILLLLLSCCFSNSAAYIQEENPDTVFINNQTLHAYSIARQQPGNAILEAHQALSAARKIEYKKGMADASLALGMAYLARYNIGDSAAFYNQEALRIYSETGDNTGIARACYGLAYVYSFKGDLEQSEKYGRRSLDNFEKVEDKSGMVNALSTLTYLARQENNINDAIEMTRKAIDISRSINDTLSLADALNTLGNIYKDLLLFNQAIDSYFEALNLWEEKKDTSGMSIAYGSIGLMYYYQKEYDRALKYNFMKLPISLKTGDKWEASKTLNNIAQIYKAQNQNDSSLYFFRKALHLNELMNYPSGIANSYHNIATVHIQKRNLDSAYHYILKSIEIADKIKDPELITYLITLGRLNRTENKYSQALENAKKAYELAKLQNKTINLSLAAALLGDIYRDMGRKDLAYDYLNEYYTINDSISNNEFLKKITRLEIQNEYDKKQEVAQFRQEQELMIRENRIKQQNIVLKGLIILIGLLIIFSVFIIYFIRLRARYEKIDIEQRLLRVQMNPHFIFNSLCAVQEFILTEQLDKANDFLVKIASLMRNILENSLVEFIPLEREIETLKLYLDIQKLRFEKEFEYNFSIDNSIDTDSISVPSMLAQPCLENSIEHGIRPNKKSGKIQINYKMENDLIKLEVIDNGIGRKEAGKLSKNNIRKKSISTDLVKKRLEDFKKTFKRKKISYTIQDLYKDSKPSGTKVIIYMPVKNIFS